MENPRPEEVLLVRLTLARELAQYLEVLTIGIFDYGTQEASSLHLHPVQDPKTKETFTLDVTTFLAAFAKQAQQAGELRQSVYDSSEGFGLAAGAAGRMKPVHAAVRKAFAERWLAEEGIIPGDAFDDLFS